MPDTHTGDNWLDAHRHFLTPWSQQTRHCRPVITGGEGCHLVGEDGRRYLDLSSGWICTNLGHGNRHVIDAIKAQAERLCYGPPYLAVDVRAEFSSALCALAPWPGGACVHFTTGGGDANDDAVRIARTLTGRHKVLAASRSLHGDTSAPPALTGGSRRWGAGAAVPAGVARFFAPNPYRSPFHTEDPAEEVRRALDHLERVILQENPDDIAAVVIEPVLGSDGLVVYPDAYLAGVRALTERVGALLIHDEVMTSFGRTGDVFASRRLGVSPDMLTFAKGVTGAYVPLGGVLMREELASAIDARPFPARHTYSGYPIAMAAGLGALRACEEHGPFTQGQQIEAWLREGLLALQADSPVIGDVRGIGAFFGVELIRDRAAKEPVVAWQGPTQGVMGEFARALLEAGVWLYVKHGVCLLAPPLTITRPELDGGLAVFGDMLRQFAPPIQASAPESV